MNPMAGGTEIMNDTRNPKAGRTGIIFAHTHIKTKMRNPMAR